MRGQAKPERKRKAIARLTSFDEFCVSRKSPIRLKHIATGPAFISRVLYANLPMRRRGKVASLFSSSIHQLSICIPVSHGQQGCALDYAEAISSTHLHCTVCIYLRSTNQLPMIRCAESQQSAYVIYLSMSGITSRQTLRQRQHSNTSASPAIFFSEIVASGTASKQQQPWTAQRLRTPRRKTGWIS